jgi:hypothetical protein
MRRWGIKLLTTAITETSCLFVGSRTLAANMANATKHGSLLQAKIQGILGREAKAHHRNDTLVAALKKAGAPIPFGTVLAPDERAEYAYDQQVFTSPLPELFSPEVETLLSSPTKKPTGTPRGFAPPATGVDAELEATKRLASEFTKLQGEADATVARLNQVREPSVGVYNQNDRCCYLFEYLSCHFTYKTPFYELTLDPFGCQSDAAHELEWILLY